MTPLLVGGEPFLLPGGRIGCLLIHGFTGTPAEMRPLGVHLNEKGFTVLGIRLFGHATRPEDMIRARRGDWLADVEAGLDMLRDGCDKVAAMGLSMGGLLALWAGAQATVEAVVCLSTPMAMPRGGQMRFARSLSRLVPYVSKGKPDWHDPEAAARHVTYPVYPTRAAAELRDLIREVRQILPEVKVPLLVVQARGDRAVPPDSLAIILENAGSVDKRTLWLEDSGHVITRDRERETVFAAASAFITQAVGAPA
jgi:carboxylesterase